MFKILKDSSCQKLAYACELNMRDWFLKKIEASGGIIHRDKGLAYGYSPIPANLIGAHRIIPFPHCRKKDSDLLFKRMLDFYRQHDMAPWCTCGQYTTPKHIRQSLRSWGFVYQYPGICMACDLSQLKESFKREQGLKIEILENVSLFETNEHPTFGPLNNESSRNSLKVSLRMAQKYSQRVWNFLAMFDGEPLGYTMLNIADGVAGIYDVGVTPSARRKNIGTALVVTACQKARSLGLKAAVLQTGSFLVDIYQKIGFQEVSVIDHWRYPHSLLKEPLPTLKERRMIAAIDNATNDNFKTALLTGKIQIAINLLKQNPEIAHTTFIGSKNVYPLHSAVWNGYREIMRPLIDLGADIEARDDENGSTPLLWAIHGFSSEGPQIKCDQLKCAEILIQAGANINAISKWDNNCFELASKIKDKSMYRLLCRYKAKRHPQKVC